MVVRGISLQLRCVVLMNPAAVCVCAGADRAWGEVCWGVNVADLKRYESAAEIQEWIRLQLQSDLDTLQIGLTGGRNSTITETTVSTTTTTQPQPAALKHRQPRPAPQVQRHTVLLTPGIVITVFTPAKSASLFKFNTPLTIVLYFLQ